MDWVPAIATFFLGLSSAVGLEWAKSEIQRRQSRRDRADDFQRQTLLDLQETLRASIDRATDALHCDESQLEEKFVVFTNSFSRALVLNPRVRNDSLRNDVETLIGTFVAIFDDVTPITKQAIVVTLNQTFKSVNDHIGDELRKL